MITVLLITSFLAFFSLPALLVVCACIAAGRADHKDERWHKLSVQTQYKQPVLTRPRELIAQ